MLHLPKKRFSILVLVIGVLIPMSSFGAPESRVALLIGNSAYTTVPLTNPAHDAEDMAQVLSECGFKVTTKINVNRTEMRNAIREFGDQIMRGGVGLFFYAGHGLQMDGVNYLVPIGADVKRKADIQDQCLSANYVLRTMEDAKNRMNIIILDACRNNPFRGFRSTGLGLALMEAPSGSILAYSTAPGSLAEDGIGRNGTYTSKLLEYIPTPGQRIEDMFIRVRNDVKKESGGRQTPWETQSLTGVFYFIPPVTGEIPPTTSGAKPDVDSSSQAAGIQSERKRETSSLNVSYQITCVYRSQGKGSLKPMKSGEILKSGDHYKIMFTPNQDGYVYLFQTDSRGQIFQLFPMESFDGISLNNVNPVKQGISYTLPSKEKAFVLDEATGREKLFFFVTRQPNAELESLYSQLIEARARRDTNREKEVQSNLKSHFKRRGVAGIARDLNIEVNWDDRLTSIMAQGAQVESSEDGGAYVLEFNHW